MTQLCTNPSFTVDTSGWFTTGGGETLTRDTIEFCSSPASGKVVTPGLAVNEGIFFEASYPVGVGYVFIMHARIKGSGILRLWGSTLKGVYQEVIKSNDLTLSAACQDIGVSFTSTLVADAVRIEARTSDNQPAQAVTFYVDDAELLIAEPADNPPVGVLGRGAGW